MQLSPPVIIFVRPQAEGNIGALARVMSNFGCRDLRLVGESPVFKFKEGDPFSQMDWAMATKKGRPVFENQKWFKDLPSALADVQIAVGSSGRSVEFERGYARPMVEPAEAFAAIEKFHTEAGPDLKWAFILGPEDDGLSDHEAALCQRIIRIATVDEAPSINAAMAAGCVLYHWHLYNLGYKRKELAAEAPIDAGPFMNEAHSSRRRFTEAGRSDWANFEHKESFLHYLMETLGHTEFLKYPDNDAVEARMRRWLQVAPIPIGELLFAFEIVYHLRAWGSGKFEARDFLKNRKTET